MTDYDEDVQEHGLDLPPEFRTKPGTYESHWNFRSSPRPQQLTVLREMDRVDALPEPPQIVLCDLPCGTGKSAINVAVASKHSGILLTPQKLLQDQLARDWPDFPVLKGSANYPCTAFRGADCQSGSAVKCRNQNCEYKWAKRKFLESRIGITNYAYFFAALRSDGFNPLHNVLAFDEGHYTEGALIDAAEAHITGEITKLVDYHESWPESIEEAATFLEDMLPPAEVKLSQLADEMSDGTDQQAARQFITLHNVVRNVDYFLQSYHRSEVWIFSLNEVDQARNKAGFRCRPLYANDLFEQFVKPLGKRIWMTSATMPPVRQMSKWMGIGDDDCHRIAMGSPFPIENRRVRYCPVAKMDRNNLATSLEPMVNRIAKILDSYKDQRGVIHSHSFALTKQLADRLMRYSDRLLVQRPESDRQALIDEHLHSDRPTVLLSPSMTEGLDLYDDLSRFTIWPKIPYAYLGDPWTKARMEDDQEWYGWQAVKTIIQGCGRSVRHDQDYCDTFILDAGLSNLWSRSGDLAPKWFNDSIIW
jgi:ATP-dependent DNA helicase DinG